MEQKRVAIFVDAENVALGQRMLEQVMDAAASHGSVVSRRAYSKWTDGTRRMQRAFHTFGFELVHVYHPVAGKNSADIQLVVDAMDFMAHRPEIGTFVLVAGDSDYSPLFRRLRERREVIGCGPHSRLSDVVKRSCTRYIYLDEPNDVPVRPLAYEERANSPDVSPLGVGSSGAPAAAALADKWRSAPTTPATGRTEQQSPISTRVPRLDTLTRKADAVEMLERAMNAIEGRVNASAILQYVQQIDPAFDYKALGYRGFNDFLRAHPSVVAVNQETSGATWVQRPSAATAVQPGTLRRAPANAEDYERLLRKADWRRPPREALLTVFEELKGSMPLTIEEMLGKISPELADDLADDEVEQAVQLLLKLGLSEQHWDDGVVKWTIPANVTATEVVDRCDIAMLSLLRSECEAGALPFDAATAAELLMGAPTRERAQGLLPLPRAQGQKDKA